MTIITTQTATPYAELLAAINFSFLRGASHPFEMVGQAAGLGLSGIGICDRNSLSGVVRAFAAARDLANDHPHFKLAVGTRLVFSDGTPDIAVYPTEFSGTHGAGTVAVPQTHVITLQRARMANIAGEMPWVGKEKADGNSDDNLVSIWRLGGGRATGWFWRTPDRKRTLVALR